MNKSKRYIVFGLAMVFTLGLIGACKRTLKKDEVLGPGLVSAPSDFSGIIGGKAVTRVTSGRSAKPTYHNTVIDSNFNIRFTVKDQISFEGELSHPVTWSIFLKGRSSKAERSFSGTGKSILVAEDSIKWFGESDGTRFFINGEKIDYTVSFLGSSITTKGVLKLSTSGGVKNYDGYTEMTPSGDTVVYVKVDDFETFDAAKSMQTSYGDANDQNGKITFFSKIDKQVNGVLSFYCKGEDLSRNNYLGGVSGESLIELWRKVQVKDPSKLYINAYIYGYGKPNSAVFFQVYENDILDPAILTQNPTSWDGKQNDMWQFIQEVNWTGWKLVSVPYSAFRPANNPLAGGNGNRVLEPHKISGFGLEIESYPNPGFPVELSFDMIYLTQNAPFKP
jgi:hypothetical protein